VLYGVSLDAPECAKLRAKGDAANSAPPSIRPHRSLARCCKSSAQPVQPVSAHCSSLAWAGFLLVCTDRVLRLAAKTEGQRDDWVEALNMHLVRSNVISKGSDMGMARCQVVMKRMGKNKKMSRMIKPLMKMYRILEEECQRDYAVAKVLERVEAAEASGRDVDLEAAQATQEAFWQAQEAMEAINAHVDVGVLMGLCEDLGLRPSEFEHPRAQKTFQHEYHVTKNMFKGLGGEDGDDDDDDWHLFPSRQLYEGALGMSAKEDARRQKRMWVAVYEDKVAFWKKKQAKMKGKKPTGYYEMSELMQADNTAHQNFQTVHFDNNKSSFFFTANAVETERWLDVISHAMIDYNSKEKEPKAYDKKYEMVEESLQTLTRTVRSKKKTPSMWRYYMLYLHGYNLELFDRLKEIRSQSNAQRVHVTSANPHMMKRRVAAQLDDLVRTKTHPVPSNPLTSSCLSGAQWRSNLRPCRTALPFDAGMGCCASAATLLHSSPKRVPHLLLIPPLLCTCRYRFWPS
jgi:hypothetical protein